MRIDVAGNMVVEIRPFDSFVYGYKKSFQAKKREKKNRNELSSKSEKRFLVNFQTKKAMTPMRATPPATDKPTIEPVPRPESEEGGVGGDDELELGAEAELVKVTTTSEPLALIVVKLGAGEASNAVDLVGGAEVVEVVDVGFELVSVEATEVGVVDVVAEVVVVDVVVVVGWFTGADTVVSRPEPRSWAAAKDEQRKDKDNKRQDFMGERQGNICHDVTRIAFVRLGAHRTASKLYSKAPTQLFFTAIQVLLQAHL